jgi:hypothetical protein
MNKPEASDDWNPSDYVHNCLLTTEAAIQAVERECSDYGGWAGEDEDAKRAVDLCQRLMGLAWVVAIHGREFAERGE